MLRKTEEILGKHIPFLPLKTYANIVEGNALRLDWNDIVPKDKLNYIMGIIWTKKNMSTLGIRHHFIPLIA